MALPGVTVNVLDNQLGIQPGNNSRVMLLIGPSTAGTPNTLYSAGDSDAVQAAVGLGKLSDAACYLLEVGGGPVLLMPTDISNAGGLSAVTQVGTGATLTVSAAPYQTLTIECTTGGTIGTAAFKFKLGTGSYGAPRVSVAGDTSTGYRVPGSNTTVVFTAGTYVSAVTPDIYIISTVGAVTHPQGAGPAVPTFTSYALDDYNVKVTSTLAGALGTGRFNYSLDNGHTQLNGAGSTSADVVSAASGLYAIPNTGVVLTFVGTFVDDDTYTFKSCSATANNTDITAAFAALISTYLQSAVEAMVFVVSCPASASAWATIAATCQTKAASLFDNGIYNRVFTEVPSVGSISASGGAVAVDSADTDAVLVTQAASVSANRVVGGAGDCLMTSSLTGVVHRRSVAWVAAARAVAHEASQNIGAVEDGGVNSVVYLFRDENASPSLDAAGYTTLRTFPGAPGFYLTDGHTMTLSTSDFFSLANARVTDRACGIARLNALPLVNSKIPTTTRNGAVGVIQELKAQKIEGRIDSALETGMVDTQPKDAVAASAAVNRTHNILADGNLIIGVSAQPFGYAHTITLNIGLAVEA